MKEGRITKLYQHIRNIPKDIEKKVKRENKKKGEAFSDFPTLILI